MISYLLVKNKTGPEMLNVTRFTEGFATDY